jgi:hypothetical protein
VGNALNDIQGLFGTAGDPAELSAIREALDVGADFDAATR